MCIHFYYTVTSFEEKKKTALNYCPCSYRDSERDRFGTTYQRVVTVKLHGDKSFKKTFLCSSELLRRTVKG